jgi:hypothetical protein
MSGLPVSPFWSPASPTGAVLVDAADVEPGAGGEALVVEASIIAAAPRTARARRSKVSRPRWSAALVRRSARSLLHRMRVAKAKVRLRAAKAAEPGQAPAGAAGLRELHPG